MKDDRRLDYNIVLSSSPVCLTKTIFTTTLRSLVLALSMLALSHAAPARAVEVAPFTGHRFGGSFEDSITNANFEVVDAASYGLVFDFDLEPDKQIEVLLSRQNTHLSTNDPLFTGNPLFDLTIDYYHIGGLYMLPAGDRVRPFLTGTFGLTRMDPKPADLTTENRFSLSLGGGAKIFFTKNLGLRFDLRGIYTSLNANTEVFCSGGCTIKLNSSGFVQTEASAALMMRF
ncbi:MAG: outer membrane beta-barrel protein [Gallionella sp.]